MILGQTLGPFVIVKELGSGAMGSVYLGKHKGSGQKVAIKMIAPGLAINETALARFKRESAILKQLVHPNIVQILASGKFHGTPFYVMEYLQGESLDHVMARRGRMTWEEIVQLGQQLCAGLQKAHDQGIIHRDLKPSNLMILKDGTVKLTDFGIAKDTDLTALTAANSTVGTAAYMSPEQCRGVRDLTFKSDLYSMGVMFYELITGKKPFTAETAMEMFLQHAKGKFERPSRIVLDMPVWLDNLICQLMDKDPNKRPLNAATVSESLGLVREKWEKQKSAGIEAATKRRIDRTDQDMPLDDEDRDAARAMLQRKKKKPKAEPFYRKGWFTILSVGIVLVALAATFYFVFLLPPSAEGLYAQAEELMAKGQMADFREARRGPLAEFLEYHANHPKAGKIQSWLDLVDRTELEQQMVRRRETGLPAEGPEKTAREALFLEEVGDLKEARKKWEMLLPLKDAKDPEERPWALVAKKYRDEYAAADDQYKDWETRYFRELATKEPARPANKAEEYAFEAIRLKHENKVAEAGRTWELFRLYAINQNDRRLTLVAAQRIFELKK